MTDHRELARTRQDRPQGGHVNYYLIVVLDRATGRETTVEVEDVIEAFEMLFCEGNVFKAVVRIAKLRQDLGKPGSTAVYDAEKCVYYAARSLAQAQRRARRARGVAARLAAWLGMLGGDPVEGGRMRVDEPKRLDPYDFDVEDMIDALLPTRAERDLLRAHLAQCGAARDGRHDEATELAERTVDAAARVLAETRERG